MKKFFVSVLEGLLVGVLMVVLLRILGIETTNFQAGMIGGGAILIVSLANSIGRMINTGKSPVYHEWVYQYEGTRIAVSAGLKEKLYVDDVLVDEHKGIALKSVSLTGKLKTGEAVQATIIGGMTVKCVLTVAGKQLEPTATMTP